MFSSSAHVYDALDAFGKDDTAESAAGSTSCEPAARRHDVARRGPRDWRPPRAPPSTRRGRRRRPRPGDARARPRATPRGPPVRSRLPRAGARALLRRGDLPLRLDRLRGRARGAARRGRVDYRPPRAGGRDDRGRPATRGGVARRRRPGRRRRGRVAARRAQPPRGTARRPEMHHLVAGLEGVEHFVDRHHLTLGAPEAHESALRAGA